MLIRELISALSGFDPDAEVRIGGSDVAVIREIEFPWRTTPERSTHHPRVVEINPPLAESAPGVIDSMRENLSC